jgi:hypothetical protein
MLGCPEEELCFATITISLAQIFISTLANPAGEYRWIGSGMISCRICTNGTYRNHIIQIDIACDGTGFFTLIGPNAEDVSPPQPLFVPIPCNNTEPFDFEHPIVDPERPFCCDLAGFILRFTE